MKKIFSFALIVFLFSACSKSDHLPGKWTLTDINYERHFESLPAELKDLFKVKMGEQFAKLKGKTFFVFNEDKSLELIAPNFDGKPITDKGTYTLNASKDSLFFNIAITESYHIDTLSPNLLVLSTEETPKRTLTLTKK
ncbi:MAG: lipocalin family protein [Bacteroidota bacterium]